MLRKVLTCLLILVSATLAAPAPAGRGAKKASLQDWPAGPIRYIARADELKTFKSLKTDADRAWFIERFWARRDPTPDTFANEYRQIFWERVREANDRFLDSPRQGWRTDRGKIHVLYGPPTQIQEELHLETGGVTGGGRGLIRWIYEGRPEQRQDLDPVVVVPFVRDAGGEYRVSYDPKLSSVFFEPLAIKEDWDGALERFQEIFGAPRKTALSVMLDLGKMQEVPPQALVLLERVETTESYLTRAIEVRLDRFLHPEERRTSAIVTVDVDDVRRGTRPSVIARFAPRDATREVRMLGEDSFQIAEQDGLRLAQGRLTLDPGTYDLTVMVIDPGTAATGMHRSTFTVKEPPDLLHLSGILFADELQSLRYAGLASHDEPYHIGPFRVIPRFGRSFGIGETVRLFFEVYGGTPPYRISYQAEGKDLDGSWIPLGKPSLTEQAAPGQAWELQTTDQWPTGDYQIRIEVLDQDDRLVTTYAPFILESTDGDP